MLFRAAAGGVAVRGWLLFPPRHAGEGGHVGTPRPRASGVGSAGVAGLGAFRGPMVFPTLDWAQAGFKFIDVTLLTG